MKQALSNFGDLLVKGDFLLVLLVIMILVIVSVIFYLVKLEVNQRKYIDEEDEEDTVEAFIDTLVEEPINEEVELPSSDIKEETIVNYKKDDIIDNVQTYENEQEEKAIISAEELDKRLKQMESTGEVNLHEKEIERYENEQEEKAIISYDELLKRASTGVINYESPEDIGGIRVSKVDFDKSKTVTISSDPYAREENFLQALKEFRRSL